MTTIEKPRMSGAELKTWLGALGVPPSWLAAHLNVTMRTVVRWFDAETVSPQVIDAIECLRSATDLETERLRRGIDKRRSGVTLKTYRTDDEYANPDDLPATWHRQVVFRLMEQLRSEGKSVTVQYA